ncbi:hypothetical protein PVK06_035634 [Gossypium arboreum]|uniref:Uncharacterized protein n=1 Tax=Gossypium arboreum TaxID=29729 RepID=A0ABR0NHC2_GOSAR|nr:hypothetical protein PVK06_035634 [Gossypium arboreum]
MSFCHGGLRCFFCNKVFPNAYQLMEAWWDLCLVKLSCQIVCFVSKQHFQISTCKLIDKIIMTWYLRKEIPELYCHQTSKSNVLSSVFINHVTSNCVSPLE